MKFFVFPAALILGAMSSVAARAAVGEISAEEFVKQASIAGLFEISSSRLALERAQKAETKEFAERMVQDHTKAAEDLKTAVQAGGLDVALIPAALDEEHEEKLSELREESGEEFDKEYLDVQEDAHDKAVRLFRKYADNGSNASLKTFAANTLPLLKQHEERSDELD
jgi:putative membrane protein